MRYFILALVTLALCGCSGDGSSQSGKPNPQPPIKVDFPVIHVTPPATKSVVTLGANTITIVCTNVSTKPVTVSLGAQMTDDPGDFHAWQTPVTTSYTIAPGASVTHVATVVGWARSVSPLFALTFTFFGTSA